MVSLSKLLDGIGKDLHLTSLKHFHCICPAVEDKAEISFCRRPLSQKLDNVPAGVKSASMSTSLTPCVETHIAITNFPKETSESVGRE